MDVESLWYMMALELDKFKILTDSMSRPQPGNFAMDRPRIEWIHCRERFGWFLNKGIEGFYFSHRNKDAEQVVRFIWKTEEIIEQTPSVFGKTNRPYATWIDLGWWGDTYTKRSLLLMLLRAGLNYDPSKNNYEEALYSEEYLKETKYATMRFLYGFTNCLRESKGWRTVFKSMSIPEIKKNLVLPEGKKKEPVVIGGPNALWS